MSIEIKKRQPSKLLNGDDENRTSISIEDIYDALAELQWKWKEYFKLHDDIVRIITQIEDIMPGKCDHPGKFDNTFVERSLDVFRPIIDEIQQGLWDKIWGTAIKVSAKDFNKYMLLRNLSVYKCFDPDRGDISQKIYIKAMNMENYVDTLKSLNCALNKELDDLNHYKDSNNEKLKIAQAKSEKKKREHERQLKEIASLGEIKLPSIGHSPILKPVLSAPIIVKEQNLQISWNVKGLLRQVSERFRLSLEFLRSLGKKAAKDGLFEVSKKISNSNSDLKEILSIAEKIADENSSPKKKSFSWNELFIQAFYHKGMVNPKVALLLSDNNEKCVTKQLNDLIKAIDVENEQLKKDAKENEKAKVEEKNKLKLSQLTVPCKHNFTKEELLNQLPDKFENFLIVLNDTYDGFIFSNVDYNGNVQTSLGKKSSYYKTQIKLCDPFHKILQAVGKRTWEKVISYANKEIKSPFCFEELPILDEKWNKRCSKWCNCFISSWKTNGYALKRFLSQGKKSLESLIKTVESQTAEIACFKEEQPEEKERLSIQFQEKLSIYTGRMLMLATFCHLNREPEIINSIATRLNDYTNENFDRISHSMFFYIWKDWYVEFQKLLRGEPSELSKFVSQNNDLIQKVLKYKSLEDIQSSITVFEEQMSILRTMFQDIDE